MRELAEKLNPIKVSPFFRAILGCMLRQDWGWPKLKALYCTSDQFILGMRQGDIGYNDFLCSRSELVENCNGLAQTVGLTAEETRALLDLIPTDHF